MVRRSIPRTRRFALIALGLALVTRAAESQQAAPDSGLTGSITGRVSGSGRALPLARVELRGRTEAVTTDERGFFKLVAPAGRHTLVARRIGYAPAEVTISLAAGETTDAAVIDLKPVTGALAAVVVTGTLREQYVSESPV